jgi:hypothetical protein
MSSAPWYLWALVVVSIGLILLVTARELRASATAVGVEGRAALRGAMLFGAGYTGWILVTAALGAAHVYRLENYTTKPWLGLGFAVPLVGLLLLTRLPMARRVLSEPQVVSRLTRPHAARVAGVIMLTAMALGELPAVFALPAGLGDIAIGLAAPWVARGLRDGSGTGIRRAIRFNILGLVDFVVALSIGLFAGPGHLQLLHVSPTTQALSTMPLVLIPTAGVPLLFTLHIISLAKLAKLRARTRVPATTVPAQPASAPASI